MDVPAFSNEASAFLAAMAKNPPKPHYGYDSVDEARQSSDKSRKILIGDYNHQGTRSEMFIPSQDVPGGIPVYVYTPKELSSDPAILVYYHGGGFVLGKRDSTDVMSKVLSDDGGFIIVNVEYRLAPEHKYPACVDDAVCAASWVMKNKERLGGSANSRVGVGGDSAGGSLAANVPHYLTGLDFQILIYLRATLEDYSLLSMKQFGEGPILTTTLIKWFNDQLFDKDYTNDPGLSCLLRDKFDHLPPALFIVAECDAIRDDSYEYQKKLEAAGVPTEFLLAKGAIHAFFPWRGVFPESTKEPYAKCVEFVKKYGVFSNT